MPLISETNANNKTVTKFQKKNYRPWDLGFNSEEVQKPIVEAPNNGTDNEDQPLDITHQTFDQPFSKGDLEKLWRQLYGAKKKILAYALQNIEESYEHEVVTKNITTEELTDALQLPTNTIKSSLNQLKKMKIVYTAENKPGRGGYARYRITKNVHSLYQSKINTE